MMSRVDVDSSGSIELPELLLLVAWKVFTPLKTSLKKIQTVRCMCSQV